MAINFKNTHGDLMDSFFDPINGNFTQKNPLHGTKKDFQAPYSADSKRTSIPQIKNGITNVDDPVYTGFTFYIDTNTSPLFFTAKTSSGSGEYVIDKSDVMAETFNERIKYARTESSKYPNNDFWDSVGVGQNSTGKSSQQPRKISVDSSSEDSDYCNSANTSDLSDFSDSSDDD